ncbi:hypothetical protein ACQKGI_20125 [Peribacillus muralis]|uniref:hypothetical protein n=1 Tax=Peribacillus muralis TaxID=264697 RepID=UPI00382B3799
MKVRVIKDFTVNQFLIQKGNVYEVRKLQTQNLFQSTWSYQIISGKYSGVLIHPQNAIELKALTTYSEKEWNDMENYYMGLLDQEREQKERLIQAVCSLTSSIKNNREVSQKLDSFLVTLNSRDLENQLS